MERDVVGDVAIGISRDLIFVITFGDECVLDEPRRQFRGFASRDEPGDHLPAEDFEHDVQVEPRSMRTGLRCRIPRS